MAALVSLAAERVEAQTSTLQVNLTATCLTTNNSGKIVTQRINNDALIQTYASENNATNSLKSLALAYIVNGDPQGDAIEVVNRADGTPLWPVFALFFPVDLPSGDGSRLERYTQLFNNQKAESIGSARISYQFVSGRTNIHGQLHFYLLPQGANGLRMCEGTFVATKPFVPGK